MPKCLLHFFYCYVWIKSISIWKGWHNKLKLTYICVYGLIFIFFIYYKKQENNKCTETGATSADHRPKCSCQTGPLYKLQTGKHYEIL